MRFSRLVPVCGVAVWLLAGVAAAQPKPADTPPQDPKSIPGTFRTFIVLDQRTDPKDLKGKRNVTGFQHDLVVANDLNPTVAVFSRSVPKEGDDTLAKLVGKLKELTVTHRQIDLGAYLFFPVLDKVYADDAKSKATADALKKWGEALAVGGVVIGLCEKDSDQTKAWKLPDTGVVIVFYNKLKVVKRWDLTDVTDDAINAVATEVNKELKK